jgi:hypothetical protein
MMYQKGAEVVFVVDGKEVVGTIVESISDLNGLRSYYVDSAKNRIEVFVKHILGEHKHGFELRNYVYVKYPHTAVQGEIMAFGEGFPGKEKAKRLFLVAFTGGSPTSWFSEDEVLIEHQPQTANHGQAQRSTFQTSVSI